MFPPIPAPRSRHSVPARDIVRRGTLFISEPAISQAILGAESWNGHIEQVSVHRIRANVSRNGGAIYKKSIDFVFRHLHFRKGPIRAKAVVAEIEVANWSKKVYVTCPHLGNCVRSSLLKVIIRVKMFDRGIYGSYP